MDMKLPEDQQAIRARCFHPTGTFTEFRPEEIEQSIPNRFEQQVAKYPERIAVKSKNYTLTYDALNKTANHVAHAILAQRGEGEEPIALLLENDAPMIASVLGVLKAGKMYVPLDPGFPVSRNADVLVDSEARLIVTNTKHFSLAKELAATKFAWINIDELDHTLSGENPRLNVSADALAYILYTSGSTGKPKGVVQNHRNVLHLIMRHTNRAGIRPDDRVALLRSFSVHGGTLQTFGALLNGAVVLPFDVKNEGVQELARWLAREEITIGRLGPTLFRHLAAIVDKEDRFPTPREISFSGESLHKNDVELCRQRFPEDCILVNSFGATEVSSCCEYIVDRETRIEDGVVPCGYPTTDMEVFLLDDHGKETRLGEIGEIAVKSCYLALGYWRKPELTQAKFLPDPKGGDARIYLTGDVGRKLPDGRLVHLWRKDFQVKIRGYRVEVSEVESTLLTLGNVKEAVVVRREDGSEEKRLVAYIVADRTPAPSITMLRRALREKLPDYMIPAAFVVLDAMPLTPNGKVDRLALPAPDQSRPELENSFVAPRTPVEELLAEIWAEVLGLERVGIHDDFFDLGGHSLLATRVVSRIHKALQLEFPLRILFEAFTVAGLAERIEEWRRKKQSVKTPAMLPTSRKAALPLSFAQQRLWFLDQLEPGSAAYNIPGAVHMKGPLNVPAFERSLNEIVRRHEALRTTFSTVDGQPFQVIIPPQSFRLEVVDLPERPEEERKGESQRLVTKEAQRPFDLRGGPLFRFILFRSGEADHVFCYTMHHIVSDGWSRSVFLQELWILYKAFSAGQPSPLPELPIQYADFAVWQRQWLQGEALEDDLAYWKQQLRDIPPVLQLPIDHPRPPVQTFRGASLALVVPKALADALKTFSGEVGVTLYMTLVAAFKILLHRLTGQDDILVGSPVARRNQTETEKLIGCFLNTLVLRTNLSGNPTFRNLLARVREVALGAYDHQDFPFEKLLEEVQPKRDLSRTPLFQVFFNMHNFEDPKLDLHGLTVKRLEITVPISMFDLTLYVRERDDVPHLRVVYNTDLFNQDRMVELLEQYKYLLSQIMENPDQNISCFSLVTSAAEKLLPNPRQILRSDWFGAVHQKLSEQARCLADHPAVSDPYDRWTYQELNAHSNQLARYLLKSGIRREDIVAVYGHRSATLIWAVLGILKAGAAFLILDPAYPTTRLIKYMRIARPSGFVHLEACGLVSEELEAFIQTTTVRFRVTLPRLSAFRPDNVLQTYSPADPEITIGPDDLAYVSYTSGSTGEPKGILGRHGSLSHFLPWQQETFDLSASDRFCMLSGLSHDPLQRDIFTPLWLGATICIPDPEIIGTPKLAEWMAKEQVTFAHLTPAMAELLTETAAPDCRIQSLRYAFFVGDKLTRRDAMRLPRLAPAVTCITSYGSTETQRAVGYYVVPQEPELQESRDRAVYPLGRGMKDVQLLVLTAEHRLAGVGELGEIYLRSPHLALGYLGDEALTRARFLTNPLTGVAGDRLYKTGDLGRYLPDGNVEFVGRSDRQVKIRGFRIEPEEVEAVLSQHPSIQQSVVLVREDVPDDKRLAAYVIARGEQGVTASELRGFVKSKLPEYMVPAAFVYLDALPLTPNGKVDYDALPASDQSRTEERSYVGPRTAVEKRLVDIWAEVLKLERVGIDENFFELGGHSLLATRVMSRVRDAFQLEIPLRTLFENPTLAGLAVQIAQPQPQNGGAEDMAELLGDVESLSDEQANRLLVEQGSEKI